MLSWNSDSGICLNQILGFMGKAVMLLSLFGILVALATAQPKKDDWDIYRFHISSNVTSRYATTVITSRVINRMNESKEIEFHVQIPKNAFISKFKMNIDGQIYDGVVKTKEQAQQQYNQAVSRGQSAGIVSSVGRTMEEFKTSVTVAAHKKITFELTYEELLKRTHGKYELLIHAQPMQPVKDFKVDVYIHEKAGISYIGVKGGLSTKALANAITKTLADKQAWVYFYPTEDQQRACDSCGEQGMNGDLVISYDVNRDNGLGDIKTSDGYFVHHFAPSNLARIPKNVVFVIDKSGSMSGRKIQQTKTALIHILNDLAEDDFFGIITFHSNIFFWKRELVQATSLNLQGAKQFAQDISAQGGTNINSALLEGARMLNANPREGSASILILLTDGDPTSGVTNIEIIQTNVRQAIAGAFPLYCLGFGFDVNFEFLEKMSLKNSGVARRIYEDSDADLQLKGFYEEVATPLLKDVIMVYAGATNLTQTNFSQYYNGSELVVAGELIDNNIETFVPQVVAISSNRKVIFSQKNDSVDTSTGTVTGGLLQRVWAYLTVKQLLEKELLLTGPEKEKVKSEALELSLKYSFVTPLTSMVVTKPQGENTDVLNKPSGGGKMQPEGHVTSAYRPSGASQHDLFRSYGRSAATQHDLSRSSGYSGSSRRHYKIKPGRAGGSVSSFGSGNMDSSFFHHYMQYLKNAGHVGRPHPPYSSSINIDSSRTHSVDILQRTVGMTTSVPVSHRLLLKTENTSLPLCFDVIGAVILKLLHHPNKELYVNGQLDSITNGGFSTIAIHLNADEHVEVNTEVINIQQGQSTTRYIGQDPITVGSFTVIQRDKEIDVAVEDVRLVIYVHEKNGNKFLWPVLRQKPFANNTEGILALKPRDYEEVQQQSDAKLKIKNREISVSSSTAADYSITNPLTVQCWLLSADLALERTLNDYINSLL